MPSRRQRLLRRALPLAAAVVALTVGLTLLFTASSPRSTKPEQCVSRVSGQPVPCSDALAVAQHRYRPRPPDADTPEEEPSPDQGDAPGSATAHPSTTSGPLNGWAEAAPSECSDDLPESVDRATADSGTECETAYEVARQWATGCPDPFACGRRTFTVGGREWSCTEPDEGTIHCSAGTEDLQRAYVTGEFPEGQLPEGPFGVELEIGLNESEDESESFSSGSPEVSDVPSFEAPQPDVPVP